MDRRGTLLGYALALVLVGSRGYALTVTQGLRANGEPIENAGAKLDVKYRRTAADLAEGYAPMKARILSVMH